MDSSPLRAGAESGEPAVEMTSEHDKHGDPQYFRTLVPLESLSNEGFERVLKEIRLRRIKAGKLLFRRGKRDMFSLYLLDGRIELSDPYSQEQIEAGSDRARHPLVNSKRNEFTGEALTDCTVAVIETALLEKYLTWDQIARKPVPGYEVREFEGTADVDWMLQMLQTKVFMRLPTANIQTLFSRFEEYPVSKGQVVVNQGEPGDYYYIVREGRARVTRHSESGATDATLAELSPPSAFGEEALLSDQPRNATVTMLTDGVLMRLSKGDFRKLMTEPLLTRVDKDKAATMIREGAIVLDVRLESEFRHGTLKGARNLPLYMVRLKANTLDPKEQYIVACDTGARSAAAAFLLSERGFDVVVLSGGLASLVPHGRRKDDQ